MTVLTLYELAGADAQLRFSPHCWKTRMALAHKGLQASRVAWRFTDTDVIGFSGQQRVPVLVDAGTSIHDSWQIALYLEDRFPERPSLFDHAAAIPLTDFVNRWADAILLPAVARIILVDVYNHLSPGDQPYFRASREARFGCRLEEVVADRSGHIAALRHTLAPLRLALGGRPFLTGAQPAYADYCVFGMFMWARCVCSAELVEEGDSVFGWRDRLLNAFDGLARHALSVEHEDVHEWTNLS